MSVGLKGFDHTVDELEENENLNILKDSEGTHYPKQGIDRLIIKNWEDNQDRNINRKDFKLSYFIVCETSDVNKATVKLKSRLVLLLNKHQQKINKLQALM